MSGAGAVVCEYEKDAVVLRRISLRDFNHLSSLSEDVENIQYQFKIFVLSIFCSCSTTSQKPYLFWLFQDKILEYKMIQEFP